jgi:hypothetical protein
VDLILPGSLHAVAKDESENPAVRQEVRAVVERARGTLSCCWFVQVLGQRREQGKEPISASLPYKAEIYRGEQSVRRDTGGTLRTMKR